VILDRSESLDQLPVKNKTGHVSIPCEEERYDQRLSILIESQRHIPDEVEWSFSRIIIIEIQLVPKLDHFARVNFEKDQICEHVLEIGCDRHIAALRAYRHARDSLTHRDSNVYFTDKPASFIRVDFVVIELHIVTAC